jgi:hypothetical protein
LNMLTMKPVLSFASYSARIVNCFFLTLVIPKKESFVPPALPGAANVASVNLMLVT